MTQQLLDHEQQQWCWEEFTQSRRSLKDLAQELGVSRDTVLRSIQKYQLWQIKEQRYNASTIQKVRTKPTKR